VYIRDGHGARLHFLDPVFNFWEKAGSGFGVNVCKSMAEMGTEPEPDSECKI